MPEGQKTRQKALAAAGLAALILVGCGGGTKTVTETAVPSPEAETRSGEPSQALVAEWPKRWCEVRIGAARKQVTQTMGAYPTEEDSGKIPLIPYIKLNANGENENEGPPSPAGSDTWEAPGSYQFNAFYDPSLHVQQLDFNGPKSELPCATLRIP